MAKKTKHATRIGKASKASAGRATASTNQKAAALPLCAVKWCAAYCAFPSMYCPVHRLDKELHPDYLGEGEILTEDGELLRGEDCEDCDGSGEHECEKCDGDGDCTCRHCDGEHDCGACEGLGYIDCEMCGGDGIRPRPIGAPLYVNPW